MKVSPHGSGFSSDKSSFRPSFQPIIIDAFRKKIRESIKHNLAGSIPIEDRATMLRGPDEIPDAHPARPEEAGWTFLINKKNLSGDKIIKAIEPLAVHRKMDGVDSPLLFEDLSEQFWGNWIDQYQQIQKGPFQIPPKYILIIGSPESIPFAFQSKLSSVAFVGRLDFDNIQQLETYAKKIKRIEDAQQSLTNKEVTFFATDFGVGESECYDPTHFNRYDIEKELGPNVEGLKEQFSLPNKIKSNMLIENDATKEDLKKSIKETKPRLVFASSWGMCAPMEEMELQKKITGGICCQGDSSKVPLRDLLFTSEDISVEPFLEAGIFFQHSSYGYGAPTSSDLNNWISQGEQWKIPKQIAPREFVSSIPKKLVFHENGPVAFIGHLDEMISYTFARNEDFQLEERKNRLYPIANSIQNLLLGRPVGYAIRIMKQKVDRLNGDLAELSEKLHKKNKNKSELDNEPFLLKTLSDKFLERHETKNYLIFGDPAVKI